MTIIASVQIGHKSYASRATGSDYSYDVNSHERNNSTYTTWGHPRGFIHESPSRVIGIGASNIVFINATCEKDARRSEINSTDHRIKWESSKEKTERRAKQQLRRRSRFDSILVAARNCPLKM